METAGTGGRQEGEAECWSCLAHCSVGAQVGIEQTVHEGVLTMSGGPNYESVAELRMFSMLGVMMMMMMIMKMMIMIMTMMLMKIPG